MEWLELTGYAATLLAFATFCMKAMLPLRYIALCSNIAFVIYGYASDVYPVLVLHTLLIPLNTLRIMQLRKLLSRVRRVQQADLSIEPLLPFMQRRRYRAGDVLFRKGETALKMYYLLDGTIRFEEVGLTLGSGQIVGIMGVFTPAKVRPWTARWQTDGELLELPEEKVMEIFCENPAFGMSLARLITRRAITDLSRHPSGAH
jgi:CRP/FNR family cyclic AMP-dependent transcriptional regulator